MRKVEQQTIPAFLAGTSAKSGNTETDGKTLWLHGNAIAEWREVNNGEQGLFVTLAGWDTPTTRSRLNALGCEAGMGYITYQHKHEQYLALDNSIGPIRMDIHRWYRIK